MVAGLIMLMNGDDDFVGPLNLGNPVEVPIMALAEEILRLTGSSSGIKLSPQPEDDPLQRQPHIGLAKEKLGWSPRISLEHGLHKTIAYFQELLKSMNP